MSEQVLTRKKSRLIRELNTVIAVMARELTVFFKTPSTLVLLFVMPIFMMGLIGGNIMGMADGEGLGTFMLVGMLVNMLFMVTAMGMTSLVDDHETDFNQEILVSPVSRYSLVIGKILGATFGAIVSMIGTLIVGLVMGITLSIGQLLLILALSPLMCFAGGAMSMILIGLIKNKKTANYAVMLLIMPQMFLSGAIIPINESNMVLLVLSRVMPMTYCIDLARAITSVDAAMFNPLINFAAIALITLVCLMIGTFFFARSEKNR
ncbi:MAG: ABC transporter permease [Candidatus Bathyarchaeota archaeon]|uniref:ABC transporter permease n=1 Tax=Candidatus Bathycorpusculum sp. TaxID=2994959 RepID=UPI002817E52A|nr:ABC transporter permease [Candidatus Termiticorpusculum sp.]MCL2256941.1 ABC transporter permease [Candidatus Termiticorpusculum sp.]MCL2292948.1 ABC transporter permease [Candidatus Termiticorpusculum sp.]